MRFHAAAVTVLFALAVPLLASADLPANKREASLRYKEGEQSYKKGDFESARVSFQQAYGLDPKPTVLWDLAVTEAKTHHAVDALRHFREYLGSPTATDSDRARARPFLEAAERETGHLRVTAASGTLVTVDGDAVSWPSEEPLDVAPGTHTIGAQWAAQHTTVDVTAPAGQTVAVDLRFPDAAPPANIPKSAHAPEAPAAQPPPTSTPDVSPDARKPGNGTRWVVASAIGAGALGALVLGLAFESQASSDGDKAAGLVAGLPHDGCIYSNSSACTQAYDATSSEASAKNAAVAMFIGAGVLAAAGVTSWFLLAPKASGQDAGMLMPQISPTFAGASYRLAF